MSFVPESMWGLLGYIAPGLFLGMGLARRQAGPVPALRGRALARAMALRALPQAALPVGWALLAASMLVYGLGAVAGLSPARALGFCLALDLAALGTFLSLWRSCLSERLSEADI